MKTASRSARVTLIGDHPPSWICLLIRLRTEAHSSPSSLARLVRFFHHSDSSILARVILPELLRLFAKSQSSRSVGLADLPRIVSSILYENLTVEDIGVGRYIFIPSPFLHLHRDINDYKVTATHPRRRHPSVQ